MTRLDALKEVAAKVEAGTVSSHAKDLYLVQAAIGDEWYRFGLVYNGSLDAAMALHEALLPDWHWNVTHYPSVVCLQFDPDGVGSTTFWASNDKPARAWLLAILRVLIAEEEAP